MREKQETYKRRSISPVTRGKGAIALGLTTLAMFVQFILTLSFVTYKPHPWATKPFISYQSSTYRRYISKKEKRKTKKDIN
jgi:hypothetical protein